jgi:hypothetical protein
VPECWERGVSFPAHPSWRILTDTCNPHGRESPRTGELRPRRELIAFPTVDSWRSSLTRLCGGATLGGGWQGLRWCERHTSTARASVRCRCPFGT